MKQTCRKGSIWKSLLIFGLICSMALTMVQTAMASGYKENRLGSISLTLAIADEETAVPLSGIPLSLYKVGSADTDGPLFFELDSALEATGVDLGNLTSAAVTMEAAQILAAAVGNSGLAPMGGVTDEAGKLLFPDLEKGMYLVVQSGKEDYCKVTPMLLSVPYSSDGADWQFDVQAFPKAEKTDQRGGLTVEKRLSYLDGLDWVEMMAVDATYYVGLFLDEEATVPYGEIKPIHIQNSSNGSVTFTDLPEGTYYLRETDAEGNDRPIDGAFQDETGVDVNCMITVGGEETTRIEYSMDHFDQKAAVVENQYYQMPEGYSDYRKISVNKVVMKDGAQATVEDVFYATIFEKGEDEVLTPLTTLQLTQNGVAEYYIPIEDADHGLDEKTFTVKETDKDGNPVNKATFAYEVTGEGDVKFEEGEIEKEITITNTIASEEPQPTEAATPTPEPTEEPAEPIDPPTGTDYEPPHTPEPIDADPVKTGDETQILMWVVLLAVAAGAIGAFVVIRRKKKDR